MAHGVIVRASGTSRCIEMTSNPQNPARRAIISPITEIPNPLVSHSFDNFESYVADSPVNELAGGWDWSGGWVDATLYLGLSTIDTFESYSSGSAVNGLNGGTDWSGSWADKILG